VIDAWTDKEIDTLRELAAQNWSGRMIAEKLRRSRNAVVGKARRLGVTLCGAPGWIAQKPSALAKTSGAQSGGTAHRIKARATAKPIDLPPPKPPPADAPRVPFLALERDACRWPFGDPGAPDFGFCGLPAAHEKTSYCAYHRGLAYYMPERRPSPSASVTPRTIGLLDEMEAAE
jgi:GcrA cell cycle regulator